MPTSLPRDCGLALTTLRSNVAGTSVPQASQGMNDFAGAVPLLVFPHETHLLYERTPQWCATRESHATVSLV